MFNDNTQQVGNDFAALGGASNTPSNEPVNGYDNGFMPTGSGSPASTNSNDSAATTPSPFSPTAPDDQTPNTDNTEQAPTASDSNNDELLSLKQDALQQLTPLVGHLEQAPEEKFRTLMMMIQATDDHSKLKEAYDTAKSIEDDKARAQALLDVINEINYFTQGNHHQES